MKLHKEVFFHLFLRCLYTKIYPKKEKFLKKKKKRREEKRKKRKNSKKKFLKVFMTITHNTYYS